MHTTKLLALGALVSATTLATAFANAETSANQEPKAISTLSGEMMPASHTKEKKHRDMRSMTGVTHSHSGMIKKEEAKEKLEAKHRENSGKREELKKRAMDKKAQMILRDTIIDKLLAGEALTEAEKVEAKKMLEERKARRDAIKANMSEAREEKGNKLTLEERKEVREETRKEMRTDK